MPTTRKKVLKTVYKDADSEPEETGDFSDSGSEAHISEHSDSSGVEDEAAASSDDDFLEEVDKKKKKVSKKPPVKKGTFAKNLISKISKQKDLESDEDDEVPRIISVKDLTEADKLLPAVLNLSESDSSDDESPSVSGSFQNNSNTQSENSYQENRTFSKEANSSIENEASTSSQVKLTHTAENLSDDSDEETPTEYRDVWSKNLIDSEELAKKTFEQLQKHANKIEETKSTLKQYNFKRNEEEANVKDLLAQGEDIPKVSTKKIKIKKPDSDSEVEDWEEVKESKPLPKQGIQLVVDFPDASYKKKKKALDVEMMMRRKINRVKKEYQIYMHKVHVLCWLGHGNYINQILNDQDIMTAVLTLMPSLNCYPGQRLDLKFVEQIVNWFKDKYSFKLDKNENKFKPKPYSLKNDLITQISSKVLTSRKYLIYIFVSLLRALGAQCRIVLNFVTLPLKPPANELCSLATKDKGGKDITNKKSIDTKCRKEKSCKRKSSNKIPQLDGNFDLAESSDSDFETILQLDGNDDKETDKTNSKLKPVVNIKKASRQTRSSKPTIDEVVKKESKLKKNTQCKKKEDVKSAEDPVPKQIVPKGEAHTSHTRKKQSTKTEDNEDVSPPKMSKLSLKGEKNTKAKNARRKSPTPETHNKLAVRNETHIKVSPRKTRSGKSIEEKSDATVPKIIVTNDNSNEDKKSRLSLSRKRSHTTNNASDTSEPEVKKNEPKARTKSAPGTSVEFSKYFKNNTSKNVDDDDKLRVSHRDLAAKIKQKKKTSENNKSFEGSSTYFTTRKGKSNHDNSDDDFKPDTPGIKKKIDRRVISPEREKEKKGMDVWCEVYVEDIEEWVAVDVATGKVHCTKIVYQNASHPVSYIVGWNNNGNLKDVTRRYVPHWNTVTRKLRVEPAWWECAIKPWAPPPTTAIEKEENEKLDRMQLEAPLPKTIHEYKNHPLYALRRHLLKFEAIYPADSATLGFVRGEAVYARSCVHVCRSRDTWLKEAKVVKMGEKPYKIVKARPKWDKLSNTVISDQPLEIFGPWQIQDYEPPTAEDGIVPRNAYGNVELFKQCMLPKGTVHIQLPGLNKIARKLNIDCAPAMTGFDFNGGYTHPVFDGFVVCSEFEEVLREAYIVEQEEQERREREKIESRVYGNWRKLIKGLLIRERLKDKYGFDDPPKAAKKKSAGPRFVAKKR